MRVRDKDIRYATRDGERQIRENERERERKREKERERKRQMTMRVREEIERQKERIYEMKKKNLEHFFTYCKYALFKKVCIKKVCIVR